MGNPSSLELKVDNRVFFLKGFLQKPNKRTLNNECKKLRGGTIFKRVKQQASEGKTLESSH
jgi:hypothetical protein